MDTLSLDAFLAIIRYGSLTEAANSLFISQSTLSHRLVELEKEVGAILIERGRGIKGLDLTEPGKEFLLLARRWKNINQEMQQVGWLAKKKKLSIGAVDTVHTHILPPLYKLLRSRNPDMNITIKTYNSAELYLQVDRGEIDVAFTLLNLPMRNIIAQKFYEEPRVVLRREKVPGKCNEFIDEEKLDPKYELFFEGDQEYHNWYQEWKGERKQPNILVDTTQLLFLLLNQNGYWAIVPECLAKDFSDRGGFTYYQLKNSPPKRVCYKIQEKYLRDSVAKNIETLDVYLKLLFR